MKRTHMRLVSVLSLAMLAAATLTGCFGGGSSSGNTPTTSAIGVSTSVATSTTLAQVTGTTENAALSTFKSKDPFIQQAQTTTSTSLKPGGGSTGSTSQTGSTIYKPTSSTTGGSKGSTSTTGGGSTSSTSTTAAHVHTLKILAVAQVGSGPAVTFQVDGTVYKDRHAGDVASTNWGPIKVLEVNLNSKVVTLLHGSETLVLSVGQAIYQ